jgi:hypothetical protein
MNFMTILMQTVEGVSANTAAGGGMMSSLIMIALLFVVMYFLPVADFNRRLRSLGVLVELYGRDY